MPKVTNFYYIDYNTNNRMVTQLPHSQFGHQKRTETEQNRK